MLDGAGIGPHLLIDGHVEGGGGDGVHVVGAVALAGGEQVVVAHILFEFVGKHIVQGHQLAVLAVLDDAARGVEQHVGGGAGLDGGGDLVAGGGEVDGFHLHGDAGMAGVELLHQLLLIGAGLVAVVLDERGGSPPQQLHLGGGLAALLGLGGFGGFAGGIGRLGLSGATAAAGGQRQHHAQGQHQREGFPNQFHSYILLNFNKISPAIGAGPCTDCIMLPSVCQYYFANFFDNFNKMKFFTGPEAHRERRPPESRNGARETGP